jgi:anion-transporting  ArsA/GET3 family ATPase
VTEASLGDAVARSKVVICVGPGGVGKTSTSAAIGIEAARRGRRVIVLTIDPARRLANALGLPEFGNDERTVEARAFEAAGLEPPAGKMTAMMLDIKRTWDEVVRRYHPDPEARDRLLANRFYQALSSALAGSQEYMAMERLYDLSTRDRDRPDLIVLDTPPAASAVDFLEAPSKMLGALDNDATRWLLEPYQERRRVSQKLFDAGSTFFIRTIGRFTGIETLQDLAEMLAGFSGMYDGFRQRARAVASILADEGTGFLVVSAPRPGPMRDAEQFHARLVDEKVRVLGHVLNRATSDPFAEGAGDEAGLSVAVREVGGPEDLAGRLIGAAREAHERAELEGAAQRDLGARLGVPVWRAPELDRDVHDLSSLDALRRHLFG